MNQPTTSGVSEVAVIPRPRQVLTAIWFFSSAGILCLIGIAATVLELTSDKGSGRGTVAVFGLLVGFSSEPRSVAIGLDVAFALLCATLYVGLGLAVRSNRSWASAAGLAVSISLAVANVAFGLRVNTMPVVLTLVAAGLLLMPVSRRYRADTQAKAGVPTTTTRD
jgi:hypothetical protein